jgi:hypothetical protein
MFTVNTNDNALRTFGYWLGGRCTEHFEIAEPATRPPAPHPWWDAVQQRVEAQGQRESVMLSAVRVVFDYIGATLDDATLDGPLLTLLIEEDKPGRSFWPGGRGRGTGVVLPGPADPDS